MNGIGIQRDWKLAKRRPTKMAKRKGRQKKQRERARAERARKRERKTIGTVW